MYSDTEMLAIQKVTSSKKMFSYSFIPFVEEKIHRIFAYFDNNQWKQIIRKIFVMNLQLFFINIHHIKSKNRLKFFSMKLATAFLLFRIFSPHSSFFACDQARRRKVVQEMLPFFLLYQTVSYTKTSRVPVWWRSTMKTISI